jgi:hypothetical protein
MFVISKKKTIPYGMDLKSCRKFVAYLWIFIHCDFHLSSAFPKSLGPNPVPNTSVYNAAFLSVVIHNFSNL